MAGRRTDFNSLDSRSVEDLARACAQRASRRAPAGEPGPCYELFRRACSSPSDDAAWQAVMTQYRKLVSRWLGQQACEDACQEVFVRFWKAQRGGVSPFESRFPNMRTVMGFLKRCAIAVRIEAWRKEDQRGKLWERLHDAALIESTALRTRSGGGYADFDFKSLLLSKLTGERERTVFELMYYYSLAPREIQAERPDLFPDTRTVYRVKENLLKRLRRDPELREWWVEQRADTGEVAEKG